LRVGREDGRKGSTVKVVWTEKLKDDFEAVKRELSKELSLQTVRLQEAFYLRVDASNRAIGAVLEQLRDGVVITDPKDVVKKGMTVPVAFLSRKLTDGQSRTWDVRDKECYAIVCALEKWASWIGLQPVTVLTDHRSLEHWSTEVISNLAPSGRRVRWHHILSLFNLDVLYIQGKNNVVADAMSRYAYPASSAWDDVSMHGSLKDTEEMEKIIKDEKAEAKAEVVEDLALVRPVKQKAKFNRDGRGRF